MIGAGIVGLSAGMEFTRAFPRLRVVILEKEDRLAAHQSGHNSGVIHSGIYYKPGSIKARTCVAGSAAMISFCREYGIRHEICGKLIVAINPDERVRLEELRKRGEANGIAGIRAVCREELKEIEPHCAADHALHVPGAGIVDYSAVCAKYAELITERGGEIRLGTEVTGLQVRPQQSTVLTKRGEISVRYVVNCGGLHSDEILRMSGERPTLRIVPFRGEYYLLRPERRHLVRNLIYPVPDPRFPFLGVHFTRRIDGSIDAGPNAILALKREGYSKLDISLRETFSELTFSGFWRMVGRYWRTGMAEAYRSLNKQAFVRDLQRLVPEIQSADLVPGGSGVRAQAVKSDGSLLDDFYFAPSPGALHVCNVPSPAATASIPVGREIVRTAAQHLGLAYS